MHKTEVFKRIGDPVSSNTQFDVGPYELNKPEYAKTNGVNARVFYTWFNGVGWIYCLGFDSNDCLVVKGEGGT